MLGDESSVDPGGNEGGEGQVVQDNQDDYYARREVQQRALAEKAEAPEIRKIHLDLADGYAKRAGSRTPPPLRIVSSN